MNKWFASVLVAILFAPALLVSSENVVSDNDMFQRKQGKTGLWIKIDSRNDLLYYINRTGTTLDEVVTLNGSQFTYPAYLFIPFSPAYIQQLKKEGHAVAAVPRSQTGYIWPLSSIDHISSSFGIRYGMLHTGIDLPARRGAPIVAVKDGMVVSANYLTGHGNSVYLQHRDGSYTRYSHCSLMLVKAGEHVMQGQIIGMVGSTGNSTGNHLHFEVLFGAIPLNPTDFLPERKDISILRKSGDLK